MRCWALALIALTVAVVAVEANGDYSEADLDLSLPEFPPPPKRDRKMLHMDEEEDSDEWQQQSELAFKASSLPRFRNEYGQVIAETFEDEEGTFHFGGDESQTVDVTPRALDEDTAEEEFSPPAYVEEAAHLRHTRGAPKKAAKKGKRPAKVATPFDLPSVPMPLNQYEYDSQPLPPPPAGLGSLAAASAMRQQQENDELFTPLPPITRQYGETVSESLSANPQAYAYANARVPPQPYQYPTQASAYAQPAPLSAPGALGAVLHDPYSNSMAGVRMGQDLAQSEYQTYSQHNWPSAVAPPAQYYLPPDVVV